jgi:hypothetical protein
LELRGVQLDGKSTCNSFNIYYFLADIKGYEHRYIEDTLEQDRVRFKPVPNVNPFLTDFMTEAAEGHGGTDNEGDTQAGGAIGSMRGILGAL